METNNSTRSELQARPPWSPLTVTILAFLFPSGGAILTVLNLHRLHQLDTKLARQLTIALIAVFAVGITILGAVSGSGSVSLSNPDVGTSALLSIGVATASYLAQRAAFRTWRASNTQASTSSWIGGAGVAAVYTLVTVVAALPVYLLLAGIAYLGGGALHT